VLDGDGWISADMKRWKYKIGLGVTSRPFAEEFAKALKEINLHPCIYTQNPKKGRKVWKVEATSPEFYSWLRMLGDSKCEEIVQSYPCDYLRGFYESEGSLEHRTKNSWRITIYNGHKKALLMAQQLMKELGISSKLYCFQKRVDQPRNKPLYSLRLSRSNPMKFLAVIKPVIKVGS